MAYLFTVSAINDEVTKRIEKNAERLGFEFVGKNDEKLLPRYPAVVVSPIGKDKEIHATHTFNVEIRLNLWIYHGNLTDTHRQRSDKDIALAEDLEAFLEEDMTLKDASGEPQIVIGYVVTSTAGVLQPRVGKGGPIVGTKMVWYCLSQKRFN